MTTTWLYGSTAEVELSEHTATKWYNDTYLPRQRRMEVENLEILGCELPKDGIVAVPSLLTLGYDEEGDISYIVTSRVEGATLADLRLWGLHDLVDKALMTAYHAAVKLGVYLTDLNTDGNIRVELSEDDSILKVWIVDVGDIY
jgi:hypothetical protein